MRTRPISEAALRKLLEAAPRSLLVGGQALAFWSGYYRIDATKDFPDGVTFDVDFLGTRKDAEAMHAALGGKLYVADLDTHTPNAAKLYFEDFSAQGEMEIDFLGALAGGDEDGIKARAHLDASLQMGNERHALKMVELVGDLATSRTGLLVWKQLALDVMNALPVDSFSSAAFKQKRLPQLIAFLAKKRK